MTDHAHEYAPDLPECDGDGWLHVCHKNTAPMDGPHAWCFEGECPGCATCRDSEESSN